MSTPAAASVQSAQVGTQSMRSSPVPQPSSAPRTEADAHSRPSSSSTAHSVPDARSSSSTSANASINSDATGGAHPRLDPAMTSANVPRVPQFSEDTASILAKYAKHPPSIELHIYKTHYRFSGQEGIIPRNNPVMSMFLKSVREGVIPPVAGEVFRDSGIQLYEGCAILKLVDYRNFSPNRNGKPSPTAKPKQDHSAKENGEANSATTTADPGLLSREDGVDDGPHASGDAKNSDTSELSEKAAGGAEADESSADAGAEAVKAEASADKLETKNTTANSDSSEFPENISAVLKNDQKAIKNGIAAGVSSAAAALKQSTPPSYRVLLRPTGSGLLQDLMGLSDAGTGRRLTDFFAISMESEILNLTVRKLDLRVPERHEYDAGMRASNELTRGKRLGRYFRHRATHPKRLRRVVEEFPHTGTAYEDFMLAMADTERPNRGASQFVRMSFIEQLRRKKNIAPPTSAATVQNSAIPGAGGRSTSAAAAAAAAAASASNQPPPPAQPTPAQLAQQAQQAQQLAQQARFQQSMNNPMAPNHVPPGPTAQHQIQAQAQQQAILRARAQQQSQQSQMMPMSQQTGAVQPGGASVNMTTAGRATPRPGSAQAGGTARPVSSMGQINQAGQRQQRPVSQMGMMNGMPMNQMNRMNQVNAMNQMGAQMGNQMGIGNNSQMQMSPVMGSMSPPSTQGSPMQGAARLSNQMNAMGNSMGRPMNAQMSPYGSLNQMGQMGVQMGGQMGSPIPGSMGSNSGHMTPQMAPQMGTIPQQVPTQMPSQTQQMHNRAAPLTNQPGMQARRPSQLSQAQMRQLMMNRFAAQRQAQAQAQQQQQQQQHDQMSPLSFSPDLS